MSILELIKDTYIDADLKASTRDEVLHRVADLAKTCKGLHGHTPEDIFEALSDREKLGTTGFGDGVAIPHCSFPDLDEFVVGFCGIPDGVDFESADDKPVYTLFFIIGPESERNRHIQILSTVSKILADRKVTDALRGAETPGAVLDIIKGETGDSTEYATGKERCLFQIVVQREEYFDQVMNILSSEVEGEIAVMEANNAGYYLHRMPLFAAYWGKKATEFCRVILAVADRGVCNDIIRRINLISDDIEKNGGILITAQNLLYAGGSLDF
jgi:mannitol/fructose-specific phosphotransferase system IIA component (Ntr-type)